MIRDSFRKLKVQCCASVSYHRFHYYFNLISHSVVDQIDKLPEIGVLDETLNLKAKDVRQEPPIPVELVIPTEKPNVEKADKITAGTLAPEIKEIVETIKTLNEKPAEFNLPSQIAVNTDIAKIDESITLKAEEKIKIIEEKESMDLQKNDNLIPDAIKKEESELAAEGDVANARAADRHEQLRKTLEKHKLEQREMMQEQKKILKDIKEQKQEFEREKQRIAKDEILKKTEKQEEIKENVLPKIKNDLKESDKRAEENEVDFERKKEEPLKEEEQNIADKEKLNENQQLQNENNDVNIAVEDKDKKSHLFQKIANNKNIGESQKISEDKSPVVERTVIEEAPEQSPLHQKDQDKTRVERIEVNDSENVKSPILNVLSKGVLQRSIVEEGPAKDNYQVKEEKREVPVNRANNTSDKLQKHDDKYSIPIALKMMNQSKSDKTIAPSLNKSEPEVLAIRRDILQSNEREKRDVDAEANANDAKVSGQHSIEKSQIFVENKIEDADHETCSKLQEDSRKSKGGKKSEKRATKSSTTETPLIKTNVYLSEQGITKAISMDGRVPLDVEYVSMQQRDLKILNPKNNIEI